MASYKALTRQSGLLKQIANADSVIVGSGITTPAGSGNDLTLTADGSRVYSTPKFYGSAGAEITGAVDVVDGNLTVSGWPGGIHIGSLVNNPTLVHNTRAAGLGANFRIEAQEVTAGSGGNLFLVGGKGSTTGGNITLVSGRGTAGVEGKVEVVVGGSTGGTFTFGDLSVFPRTGLHFNQAMDNPHILHEPTSTTHGSHIGLEAQTTTMAGGVGGNLSLVAGTGVATGGSIELVTGGGTAQGSVILSNSAATAGAPLIPKVTETGYIGTASAKWGEVNAKVVNQGDTGFTDTHCPKCSRPLCVGDTLDLYAYKESYSCGERVLRTVPAHRHCFMARLRHWLRG